jgi:hypothetical protein
MEEILQGIPPEAVELYELTVRKLTNMVRRLESPRQGHLMVNCHPDEGEGALYSVGPGRKRTPKPEPVTQKLYPTRFEREDVI